MHTTSGMDPQVWSGPAYGFQLVKEVFPCHSYFFLGQGFCKAPKTTSIKLHLIKYLNEKDLRDNRVIKYLTDT